MIRGRCWHCGATGDLTAFAAGERSREALKLALKLPREVQVELMGYFALFEPGPGKRSVPDETAARLMATLVELAGAGTVKWKQGAERACPPRLWAEALRIVIAAKDSIELPLKSHGYLTSVAYKLASKAEAKSESRPLAEAQRRREEPEEAGGLSEAAREQIRLTQELISGIGRKV